MKMSCLLDQSAPRVACNVAPATMRTQALQAHVEARLKVISPAATAVKSGLKTALDGLGKNALSG